MQQTDLAGKRLELVREVIPGLRRLAILANIEQPRRGMLEHEPGSGRPPARSASTTVTRKSGEREEIAPAFDALKGHAEALYVVGDALMVTQPGSHHHHGASRATANGFQQSELMLRRAD